MTLLLLLPLPVPLSLPHALRVQPIGGARTQQEHNEIHPRAHVTLSYKYSSSGHIQELRSNGAKEQSSEISSQVQLSDSLETYYLVPTPVTSSSIEINIFGVIISYNNSYLLRLSAPKFTQSHTNTRTTITVCQSKGVQY